MAISVDPHISLSTDELAILEIHGEVEARADNGQLFTVQADNLSLDLSELSEPFGESIAIGDGYTVSA